MGAVPPSRHLVRARDFADARYAEPGWAGMFPGLTIEICPPSLETGRVPAGTTLGLRPAPLPLGPPTVGPRPRVYVTFGTLFNQNLDLFRVALDALAPLPVEVVVTIGRDHDPAALAPHPANARVERFVPQAELLPSCQAIVHHGGAGTMFGALAHGVPQVIVPQGADNFEHTDICERAGVAVGLRPGEATPDALARAVQQVLDDPGYREAGARVAAEIAALPDAASVAATLRERFAPGGH